MEEGTIAKWYIHSGRNKVDGIPHFLKLLGYATPLRRLTRKDNVEECFVTSRTESAEAHPNKVWLKR